MKTRHKRMAFILVGLAGLSVAAWLVLNALNSNLALYISPTDVLAGDAPKDQTFRLGGLVVEDSLRREDDGLTVHFEVTDSANTIPVTFTGILPDLFDEGQGVVAQGKMQGGVFAASEVLAKHDENYMPAEVAEMLEEGEKLKQQYGQSEGAATVPQTP
ncbi:MAG: cytochrome c maturation protein CcmE [Gammaproteobacteria bacterium]|nr:cytochrome c maturation protein CcmE [Gammaproteobacteria bacterium]MCF6362557.1 cytochrome c maturation protein CcmE [Gammaproteobacteria bacterium]